MTEKVYRADEVYGIGRDLPLNYVQREDVDDTFVENLTRDKHVVVFGSSKQGKTSLRKNTLQDTDCVTVSCLNTMSLNDLHSSILKAIGYRIEISTTKSQSGSFKVLAKFTGKGKVPFIGELAGEAAVEGGKERDNKATTQPLELELNDVNDIIAAINEVCFSKFIVLEDFHYLPVDTQQNFCFALKSFHENSNICFIIIGVWREKGRLEYYNGDLNGRIVSIDVDEWKKNDLAQVVKKGESLLNLKFDEKFLKDLFENSYDSVHIVQEACLKVCQDSSFYDTQKELKLVGTDVNAKDLVEKIVVGQAGRYNAFITNFAEGFQKTELEMYKWLIYAVINCEISQLEKGLRRSDISEKIKQYHPQGSALNEGNITQALQNAASLQVQKSVRPIVIDYDQTTKVLHVVDKSFLVWLAHQDVSEISKELGI